MIYSVMKLFAGDCAPGAEETCRWILRSAEEHEQYVRNILLTAAVVMVTLASILILYLLSKRHKNELK